LNVLLLVATVASSLELRAEVVGDRILQVLLVPRGPVPVVTTTRTILGCYLEVEVQDSRGVPIGHIGPRASCAAPRFREFRALWSGESPDSTGAQVFGVQFDLLAPDRVRIGPKEEGLESGQEYRIVVTYRNDDATVLSSKEKGILRKRYGNFWSAPIHVTSPPISFKCP
jgi:hypothetical protein